MVGDSFNLLENTVVVVMPCYMSTRVQNLGRDWYDLAEVGTGLISESKSVEKIKNKESSKSICIFILQT